MIFISQGFFVKSFASTKSHCEIYLNPTSYYDFEDLEKLWMEVVTKQLKALRSAYIRSGKAESEPIVYEMIAKKSGITVPNVRSHFVGRILTNLKFAAAAAEVFEVDIDFILAKDFFDQYFKDNFVIYEHHFDGRHHRVLSRNLNFLYWSRNKNPLSIEELKACLRSCSTEMLIEELKSRGLHLTIQSNDYE